MKNFAILAATAFMAGALSTSTAQAAPVLDCAGGAACNGIELGAELITLDAEAGEYRIDIAFDFDGYVGAETDLLAAIGVAELVEPGNSPLTNTSFQVVQGTLTGGSFGAVQNTGLSADGCNGGQNGLCVETDGIAGIVLNDGGDWTTAYVSFFFSTTGTVNTDSVHIKYQFIDAEGNKVLSLGSFDQPYDTCDEGEDCDPNDNDVPEPTTLAMLGIGLLGAGYARRRRQ